VSKVMKLCQSCSVSSGGPAVSRDSDDVDAMKDEIGLDFTPDQSSSGEGFSVSWRYKSAGQSWVRPQLLQGPNGRLTFHVYVFESLLSEERGKFLIVVTGP
jgi:uncharacterized protein YfiM (DUF2279 family)